jgi:hypothetical protein
VKSSEKHHALRPIRSALTATRSRLQADRYGFAHCSMADTLNDRSRHRAGDLITSSRVATDDERVRAERFLAQVGVGDIVFRKLLD